VLLYAYEVSAASDCFPCFLAVSRQPILSPSAAPQELIQASTFSKEEAVPTKAEPQPAEGSIDSSKAKQAESTAAPAASREASDLAVHTNKSPVEASSAASKQVGWRQL